MSKNASPFWTLSEKISFRFVFLLFVLFIFLFNNSVLPIPVFIVRNLSEAIVAWISNGILGLDYIPSAGRGGSGDTLFHYIMLLFVFSTSALGCALWSFLDKKKPNYNHMLYWLTVIVRFYIAIMLIHYGLAKIIKTQFASPDLMRLLTTYGDTSPMGLAWTFLGFSDGYNLFMGIAEVGCGLLLFRRTVVLGAIIALMVSSNVMAVNYFFDVPVKIISTALVLMSLFLLVPNFYRLRDFFLLGKSVGLKLLETPPIEQKWLMYSKIAFKYVLIIFSIVPTIFISLNTRENYGDRAPKLPLYGVYTVDSFESEQSFLKWEKLIIQRSDFSAIRMENSTLEYFHANVDTIKNQIEISFNDDLSTTYTLKYTKPDDEHLELSGTYFDRPLKVKLQKQHFELTERPFSWVSEVPYNR